MKNSVWIIPNKKQFILSHKNPLSRCRFIIVPVPYEQTTSYGHGTKKGPSAILDASYQLELLDEELGYEIYRVGIFTAENFRYTRNEKEFFLKIGDYVERLINTSDAFPIFLGGEHSITQGLIPPFEKKYRNFSILHFDAHADLRNSYEGTKHSHASALYPASLGLKIVQIGIRSIAPEEKHLINSKNVRTFLMHENLDFKKLIRNVLDELTENVYITIDVDGFDPSVMPATGTPQPGGFLWYDAISIFREVIYKKNVVGFDVVEVSPLKNSHITEFNAAKLIYKLIGYISKKRGYIK